MINTSLKPKLPINVNQEPIYNTKLPNFFITKRGTVISWIHKKINDFSQFDNFDNFDNSKIEPIRNSVMGENVNNTDSVYKNVLAIVYKYDSETVIMSYIDCDVVPTKLTI